MPQLKAGDNNKEGLLLWREEDERTEGQEWKGEEGRGGRRRREGQGGERERRGERGESGEEKGPLVVN